MFRNVSGKNISTNVVNGERDLAMVLEALLVTVDIPKPLHPKVTESIAVCSDMQLLHRLASHESVEVRRAVASNQKLPDELFWKLAGDAQIEVRAKLAENVHLATFLLETLAEDEDERIATRAQRTLDRQASDSLSDKVIHWMFAALPSRQIS